MLCIEKERLPSFPDARGEIIKSFVSSTILIKNLVFSAHCMSNLKYVCFRVKVVLLIYDECQNVHLTTNILKSMT